MSHEEDLYGLLKESEETQDDEDKSTVGTTNVYDNPPERSSGDIDAPWGEKGPQVGDVKTPVQYSEGVIEQEDDTRQGVSDRAFSGKGNAHKSEQQLMAENFEHVSSGDFTTHSMLLKPKQKLKMAHPRIPTLREQVLKVAGRY